MTAVMAVTAYPSKQAFDFLLLKSFTFLNYIHNVQTMLKNSQNVIYLQIKYINVQSFEKTVIKDTRIKQSRELSHQ